MLNIYHNPRCSKSRQTLALLTDEGYAPKVIEYLKTPLTAKEIAALFTKLGLAGYRDMMRTGETVYKDMNLKTADEHALLSAMAAHPILIERPIVETRTAARIGRPPEAVLAIVG
jgi:arsenate reductase (glutaredoxin)